MDVRQLARGPYWGFLGMVPEMDRDGTMVVRMRVTENHLQIMGRVHGGVLAALIDSAMAIAVHERLAEGGAAATLDMHVSFVQPVREGWLTGRGRVLSLGRVAALAEADILDEAGTLIATGRAAYRIYPPPASGSPAGASTLL